MIDAEFLVEQHGAPSLSDGQPSGPAAASAAGAPFPPATAAIAADPGGWTPEQAEAFLLGIWNIGCLFYGPAWAGTPEEFKTWEAAAANLLDSCHIPPPGQGGVGGMTVALVQCAGGISLMVYRRGELIRQGPVFGRPKAARPGQPVQHSRQAEKIIPRDQPIRQEGGDGSTGKLTAEDSKIIELHATQRAAAEGGLGSPDAAVATEPASMESLGFTDL